MLKKVFIVSLLALLSVSTAAAKPINASFGIDLRGGASMLNLSDFNSNFSKTFEYGYGIKQNGSSITDAFQANINIKYFPIPNLAAYLRGDVIYTDLEDVLTDKTNEKEIISSYAVFSTLYAGLGAKYYFQLGDLSFYPYASLDFGMNFPLGSYWEVTGSKDAAYSAIVGNKKYSAVDFTNSFFGLNFELGGEYLFNDIFGISIGGGYRYAVDGKVTYDKTSANGIFNENDPLSALFKLKEADISGFYGLGGLVLHFGGKPETETPAGLPALPGALGAVSASPYAPYAQKYEAAGDMAFKQKNYKNASAYYTYATKYAYAAKLPTVAGIYKKIGLCYYYMGDKTKALAVFGQYLKMTPADYNFKAWVDKYRAQP